MSTRTASVLLLALVLASVSCTPAQRAPVRTALEVNSCVNSVVIRHIDAGDDFKDPNVLTELAIEIASECNPLEKKDPQ